MSTTPTAKTPKAKKPRRREQIVNLLIRCLVAREGLAYAQTTTCLTSSERARVIASRSAELSAAQIDLERFLFRATRADHLDGVDRIYGLKRRVVRYRSLSPALRSAANAA